MFIADTPLLEEIRAWTQNGVTTVLDLGGSPEELLGRKRATAESEDAELPRLLVSGPMITVPGGHPIPIYGPDYPALAVRGSDDAKSQIERLLSEGVDHIKIAVSGRVDTGCAGRSRTAWTTRRTRPATLSRIV
jgi:hypothetical protein